MADIAQPYQIPLHCLNTASAIKLKSGTTLNPPDPGTMKS